MKPVTTLTRNPLIRERIAPLIIGLTLLFSVLIVASTPPVSGYELSLYDAYPAVLWVLIAVNIFFSIYTILRSCDSQYLCYGYFSILFLETIFLFLPIIRGYYSMNRGGGDMYHHMFVATQILHSGYVPLSDFYPMMHIWLSALFNFLPDFILLIAIFSTLFFILYVASLYLLGTTILGTKKGGIFISIFGVPLIFSFLQWGFIPFFFALINFPLILFVYQKIKHNSARKKSFYCCLIVLCLFTVFCHPMISVFLIITFSVFAFFELFKGWSTASQSDIEAANIVIIVSLTLVLWWLQFRSIMNTLQKMSAALLGGGSHISIIDYQMDVVATSHVSIGLVVEIFIKTYGPVFLYILISFLFLLYMMYQYYQNRKIAEDDFMFSIQFCLALFLGAGLMVGSFSIFEPIRAAMLALIFATILCGLFLYRIWSSGSKKLHAGLRGSVSLILTLVCMLSILALYASPWISAPNPALTYGDKKGIDWVLQYRNEPTPIVSEDSSVSKYSHYYYETANEPYDQVLIQYRIIPSDFGYMTNRTIGDSFAYLSQKQVYMTTTKRMELTPFYVPAERRDRSKWFTDSDLNRLNNDPSAYRIYSGNEFGVWNVAIH